MKTLVVDDDQVSRSKLEAIMSIYGPCESAGGGVEAVEIFENALKEDSPFDLVALDIKMPDKDGTETLLDMRGLEEECKIPTDDRATIIMVTGLSDRDSLITCVQAGCNDYVVKPFDRKIMSKKLQKFGIAEPDGNAEPQTKPSKKVDVGIEILRQFKNGELNLPSPPTLFTKFRELVEKGADLKEIAEVIKPDIAVSFQLISVSNSPYYRGVQENRTLEQAVSRLGINVTRQYVEVLSTRAVYAPCLQKFKHFTDELWNRSLATAHAAEALCKLTGRRLDQDPFTLGLFHEIGKLVLIQIISELEEKDLLGGAVSDEDMQQTLEAFHGQMGAALMREWDFAPVFAEVAAYCDQMDEAKNITPELLITNAAHYLARRAIVQEDQDQPEDPPSFAELGLDQAKLEEVMEELAARLDGIAMLMAA